MKRLRRIGGLSPIKPRKLTKRDIYPPPEQTVMEENIDDDDPIVEIEPEKNELNETNKQQVHTNPTVLSKQIKIVTQLNAKQVDALIADRNTIKAHGLQQNMRFYDSFGPDLVDIVYYQAVAEGICMYEEQEIHDMFNENEDKIMQMLRKTYINDDKTSNIEKIKAVQFDGTSPEQYSQTLVDLQKLQTTLNLTEEEEKMAMEHMKRKMLPSSPFSANLKSILINHLFGDKETEVRNIKEFILGFLLKMKEVQEVAEKARSIGLSVGLSPGPYIREHVPNGNTKRIPNGEEKKQPSLKRCWYCGSDPQRQNLPHRCNLWKKEITSCSFRNHPDVKNNDHSKPWKQTPNGEAYCALRKFIVLNKKLNGDKKELVDNIFHKKVYPNSILKKNIENINNFFLLHQSGEQIEDAGPPVVQLFLSDKKNEKISEESFQSLIDPGSYSYDKSSIVSYVSDKIYKKIKAKYSSFIVGNCSCNPTKTCTAVGCFTSTNCVNLSCILSANNIKTKEILIPFRIVKSLPINEIIIGLQDVRKHC